MSGGPVGTPEAFARVVVAAALEAADPARAVEAHWPAELDGVGGVTVMAIGKGAPEMAGAALARLGGGARRCVVVYPPGVRRPTMADCGVEVEWIEADHPIPSERSRAAAARLRKITEGLGAVDHALVLVSGGGSALCSLPREGVDFGELAALTRDLLRSGATIYELNAVRSALEVLKAGGLARRCAPAPVTALILSDVLGDPVHLISSGPTAADVPAGPDPGRGLREHGLSGRYPTIDAALAEPVEAGRPASPIVNIVIGSNQIAAERVADVLREKGIACGAPRLRVEGHAAERARELAALIQSEPPGSAVVWGGETTVDVGESTGVGGRSQEFALAAALGLEGAPPAWVVAFGTDGIDGPTDAAGAVVSRGTCESLRRAGIDPADALANHDSHAALDAVGALIRTGPTGTNVNDIYAAVRLAEG